jgi:serine protease AprX
VLSPGVSFAEEGAYPATITDPLREVLEQAAPDELIPVSVILKEQGRQERIRGFASAPKGTERREAIARYLRSVARRSQAGLLDYLSAEQGQGKVGARIRPLWIGNIVGFDATPAVIEIVARRPEVERINHNPKVDVFLEGPAECSIDAGSHSTSRDVGSLLGLAPAMTTVDEGTITEIECGTDLTRAPEVWNEGNTGEGAIIAVIDTGVCYTHPDIANQIWVNPGEDLDADGVVMDPDDQNGVDDDGNGFIDDLIGWDFDVNDNNPNDDSNGHGSHVAGTVAGDGTSGTQSGMAPDAKIMVLRVGVSFADEVDVWNAMQYAAENGADSISMSLGWPHNQNPDRATWRSNCENTIDMGTAMVIAAGNEGSGNEPDNVRTPGDVPRIISVGATNCSDGIAGFSSRGPVTWQNVSPYNDHPYPPGLIKPDVSAPGVSTKSHNFCSGYSFKSGTSMATPHTAGAVALMVASDPSIEHDEIKQILEETSIDLGAAGKDNTYGSGRIDAFDAVDAARPKVRYRSHRVDDSDPDYGNGDTGVDTGETLQLIVTVMNETDHPVSDVRAFVTTDTPGVRMRNTFARFPDLVSGEEAESLSPHFTFTVDSGCFYDITFRIEVRWDEPVISRKSFLNPVGSSFPTTLIDDDFETDSGDWTPGADGATDGFFVREDPVGTEDLFNREANPEDDHTPDPGTDCWVSGNGGGAPDFNDIDGGLVMLTSPVVDAHNFESLNFSYWRWFYASPLTNPGGFEFWKAEVSNNGGASWTVLEDFQDLATGWQQQTFDLALLMPLTSQMRFRFSAQDSPTNFDQTVEAGVDDVKAEGSQVLCDLVSEPAHLAPNDVGDTLLVSRGGSTAEVFYDWAAPPADAGHDPATFYRVWESDVPSGGFSQTASPTANQWVEPDGMAATESRYWLVSASNSGGDSAETP